MGRDEEEGRQAGGSWFANPTKDEIVALEKSSYTVRQKVIMDGKPLDLHAADSSTWIRGANGWECHAHSEAFLAPKNAA